MLAHLLTGGPAPAEWMEFELADRFHWDLSTIRALSLADRLRLRTMMVAEARANKAKHA